MIKFKPHGKKIVIRFISKVAIITKTQCITKYVTFTQIPCPFLAKPHPLFIYFTSVLASVSVGTEV